MMMSNQTVVIGGTGFIGSALVAKLLKVRKNIIVASRSGGQSTDQVTHIQMDCADVAKLKRLLSTAEEIIDLSYTTTPKTSFDDPMSDLVTNLPRVVTLLEACKSLVHLQKLIIISSGGTVYGKTNTLPIEESAPTNPISPYGITKLTIEKYTNLYHELYLVPTIILRPANAYGPQKEVDKSQGFIANSLSNVLHNRETSIYGENGTIRDYIYVDDLAEAIISSLTSGKIGATYNVGTGIGTSNLEIIELIQDMLKNQELQCSYSISPSRAFDVPANILSSQQLQEDTGWLPRISLREGIQTTLDTMIKAIK